MNELGLRRIRGVLRRRRAAVAITAGGGAAILAVLLWQVPPSYRAAAVIRAAEVQPAKDYVAPTVVEQVGNRLRSLRLAVMARPLVAQAARELDLAHVHPGRSMEQIADAMRARMDVKLEGEDTFLLTYSDGDPERAQAVVNRVAQLFIAQQVAHRRRVATAASGALRSEAARLQPELEQAFAALRAFKLAHHGALPEQLESNLRALDQTTMELNIQATNLDYEEERRRAILAGALSPLRHQEDELTSALHGARAKYTADNPEVLNLIGRLAEVRAERTSEEAHLAERLRRRNPELAALERQIDRTRAMLRGLRLRQGEVRGRVEETAKNGQALAALELAYQTVRDKHQSTVQRMRDAELAERLEEGLAALRFDLVEGAVRPHAASAPGRPVLALGGLLLALALGLGAGLAAEAADRTIRDPEQLRAHAPELPILASVPHARLHGPLGPKAEA